MGGNAIDAAVATSFALAATRPYSTGLGGGGFMIVRFADGRIIVQDFRETAPAAATPEMYVEAAKRNPDGPPPSRFTHLAVAVPGLVAGRCQALAQWGTMSLQQVTAPAIRLAEDGFTVDKHYVTNSQDILKRYQKYPGLRETGTYVYETHLGSGQLRSVGDVLRQPKLARLLRSVADNGPDFFYKGPVAAAIADEMKQHGGLIKMEDLANYTIRMREPIRSTYRRYALITMPPPSSGGITVAEILNILEPLDLPSIFKRDPLLATHYQIEAMKHGFADRARWLGDTDFVEVPVERLTSKGYAKKKASRLKPDRCLDLQEYGSTHLPDDEGTSHFSVVDRWGNIVVSTETINTVFGSLAAVDDWGLILNNQMDDFSAEPGKPNAFGLIQSARNAVHPGKRPLSSMSPTILLKDGEPYLMLGGSGGPRIISSVLNVILGVTDYDLSLEEAMLSLRPHHQWKPDRVFFDASPPDPIAHWLRERGHKLAGAKERKTGIIQAIIRTEDGWMGASDPRKGGRPAGY
jgi:gamma-glutamyltranspeptidase/glutathione hydrolase